MERLVVLVVTDALVSLSSVVTEFCDDVSVESEWEFVEPQSFSLTKKRSLDRAVKAPLPSNRRMMPPTPQQSSSTPVEEMQWQTEMGVQGSSRSARERRTTVTA